VRGDVYWGWGDKAALIAGHMKSPGSIIVLLPKKLAARLLNAR
jgi:membrane-bound lytic murein transglycosylase A